MEHQSPTKRLILLVGLPAAGKSTLAKELSNIIDGSIIIDYDFIEEGLK
jgi:adenylate kinase family enzyme